MVTAQKAQALRAWLEGGVLPTSITKEGIKLTEEELKNAIDKTRSVKSMITRLPFDNTLDT